MQDRDILSLPLVQYRTNRPTLNTPRTHVTARSPLNVFERQDLIIMLNFCLRS